MAFIKQLQLDFGTPWLTLTCAGEYLVNTIYTISEDFHLNPSSFPHNFFIYPHIQSEMAVLPLLLLLGAGVDPRKCMFSLCFCFFVFFFPHFKLLIY